jgi:L-asparaginase II
LYAQTAEEKSGSVDPTVGDDSLRSSCFVGGESGGKTAALHIGVTHSISELGAEGVFVEADFGGVAGLIVDCEDVKAERAIAYVALG